MEIDVTQIAVSVIGLMSVIITSVIVPLIRSKVSNDQWEAIKIMLWQVYKPQRY